MCREKIGLKFIMYCGSQCQDRTQHTFKKKKKGDFFKIMKYSIEEIYWCVLYLLVCGIAFINLSLASSAVLNNHGKGTRIYFTNFSNNLNCL